MAKGITTEKADFTVASLPYALQPARRKPSTTRIRQEDADFYARLEKAGFKLYLRRGRERHRHDVYAPRLAATTSMSARSDLIAVGRHQATATAQIERTHGDGVVLEDGTALPADLIVYATGYGSMNQWAAR